jgi:hypothetical protein
MKHTPNRYTAIFKELREIDDHHRRITHQSKWVPVAIVLLGLLQVVDGSLTYWLITAGVATEANPLAAHLFNNFGLAQGVVLAKAPPIFLCYMVWTLRDYVPGRPWRVWIIYLLTAFYVGVIGWEIFGVML